MSKITIPIEAEVDFMVNVKVSVNGTACECTAITTDNPKKAIKTLKRLLKNFDLLKKAYNLHEDERVECDYINALKKHTKNIYDSHGLSQPESDSSAKQDKAPDRPQCFHCKNYCDGKNKRLNTKLAADCKNFRANDNKSFVLGASNCANYECAHE